MRFHPPPCLRYLRARDLLSLTPSQWHSNLSSISTLAPSLQSSEVPFASSTPTSPVVLAKQSSHYPFRPPYHPSRVWSPFGIYKQYTLNPCRTRPAVKHPTVASSPSVSPSKSPRLAPLQFFRNPPSAPTAARWQRSSVPPVSPSLVSSCSAPTNLVVIAQQSFIRSDRRTIAAECGSVSPALASVPA